MKRLLAIFVLCSSAYGQRLIPGIGVGGTGGGGGTGCTVAGTAGQLVSNDGATGCNSVVDWVYTTHTLAGSADAILDLHLMDPTALKVPGGYVTGVLHVTTTTGAVTGGLVVTADITNANVTAVKMVNAGVFTGDVTTTFPAITVAKVNGIAYSATGAAHSIPVITTANTTATYKVLPDCTDTGGNHLNFTASTDTFSCGTSGGSGGGVTSVGGLTGVVGVSSGITTSGSDLVFDSSVLTGVYATLAGSQNFGVNNTCTSSATEACFELVAAVVPSSINNGGLIFDLNGNHGIYNGTNVRYWIGIDGSGRTAPTAPSAGVLHVAGSTFAATSSLIVSADLNITTTTCTNQFLTAISATGTGTCTTSTLAGAQYANQGTTTTVLHGNAAGNPSWTQIVNGDITNSTIDLTAKVTGVLPTANIAVALANQTSLRGNSMAAAAGDATIGQVIAHGAKALATGAISSAACTSAQTDTATGTATTDVVTASFNGDPTAVTGYVPLTAGMLTIIAYPSSNTVNFKVCNNTTSSITPGAITLNWTVIR